MRPGGSFRELNSLVILPHPTYMDMDHEFSSLNASQRQRIRPSYDTGSCGRREMTLFMACPVEIANVTVEIYAMLATLSGHRVDELETVEHLSEEVFDNECARAIVDVDIEVVVMMMKRNWKLQGEVRV
jgi:hypothetical protein